MRKYAGWLNIDLKNSDYNVDVAAGRLPWAGGSFHVIISLHFIEHLDLLDECLPLLFELHRLLCPGGELWLACPDMEKVCRAYLTGKLNQLLEDRRRRWPAYDVGLPSRRRPLESIPSRQKELVHHLPLAYMVNDYFHQYGEHRNLYDEEILTWALATAGFMDVQRVDERALRSRFPEIWLKGDDCESIYIRAVKPLHDAH
jgi:SAM-dependent methyltransferase